MWHDMFAEQIPLAEKILRTVIVYAVILVLTRLAGKRAMASLSSVDFIVLFLLSNVVQNAIIGNDNSLVGGVVGAVTLVATNAAVNWLTVVSPTARRLFEGGPITVISHGRVVPHALRRLRLRRADLDHAVRTQNGDDIDEVADGRLEPNGALVLTLKRGEQAATKDDVAGLTRRLQRIEELLSARG